MATKNIVLAQDFIGLLQHSADANVVHGHCEDADSFLNFCDLHSVPLQVYIQGIAQYSGLS